MKIPAVGRAAWEEGCILALGFFVGGEVCPVSCEENSSVFLGCHHSRLTGDISIGSPVCWPLALAAPWGCSGDMKGLTASTWILLFFLFLLKRNDILSPPLLALPPPSRMWLGLMAHSWWHCVGRGGWVGVSMDSRLQGLAGVNTTRRHTIRSFLSSRLEFKLNLI